MVPFAGCYSNVTATSVVAAGSSLVTMTTMKNRTKTTCTISHDAIVDAGQSPRLTASPKCPPRLAAAS